mgnify:CR=1 FL=1
MGLTASTPFAQRRKDVGSQPFGRDQVEEIDPEALYTRYGPMVLRRCRAILGDEDRALDAMQDVFVQLMVKQDRLDDRAPSSLLYRMATNTCLNRIRSEKRRSGYERAAGQEQPGSVELPPTSSRDGLLVRIAVAPDPGGRAEARSLLDRLFGKEKESTRVIAVLHLLDGLTLEEVAREVGLSVSGVRKRLRTLRTHLAELEGV